MLVQCLSLSTIRTSLEPLKRIFGKILWKKSNMKTITYVVHDKRGSETHPWSISSHEKKYKIDSKTKKVVSTWTNEKSHIDGKNYYNQKAATTAAKKLK